MFLKEYEGSSLFAKYGIPVPAGLLLKADTLGDAEKTAAKTGAFLKGFPENAVFAVKAQLTRGGRGKSGAIAFADKTGLNDKINDLKVKKFDGKYADEIVIQEKIEILNELYLAAVINRSGKCVKLVFSVSGGVEIEETAQKSPEKIGEADMPPAGWNESELINFFKKAGCDLEEKNKGLAKKLAGIALRLLDLFEKEDAVLAEINPLALGTDGDLRAIDAKVIIDDNALSRHAEWARLSGRGLTDNETEALKAGLSYVELDGDTAVVGNGAGLVMATLDSLEQTGGRPANFCDVGGGAGAEAIGVTLKTVLNKQNVTGLFINIFGGITRCDEIARGIAGYAADRGISVPAVVRITGTNEKEGRKILEQIPASAAKGIQVFALFDEAVKAASRL